MRYYSTHHKSSEASLDEAIIAGRAPDGGLYMPKEIKRLPQAFIRNMSGMSLIDIGYVIANTLLGEDIDSETLKNIVAESLNFDIPLHRIEPDKYALELFHGPTMAFKDIGARFMARILRHYNRRKGLGTLHMLVATSGGAGSAVANSFLGLEGVKVTVLYPKGQLSRLQEAQFTTLGQNVNAIEVIGSIDDCQKMVDEALADNDLKRSLNLATANSVNIARLLPQVIYYFHAWAQLSRLSDKTDNIVFAIPCGNLANLVSGLIAKRMGLPIKRFLAASNSNDVFTRFLESGKYAPMKTIHTSMASSMDKGHPTNICRIIDLYNGDIDAIRADIISYSYNDRQIASTITDTLLRSDYLIDPHTSTAYRALREHLNPGEIGIVMSTAHPAKFKPNIERVTGQAIAVPPTLSAFMHGEISKTQLSPSVIAFKKHLATL